MAFADNKNDILKKIKNTTSFEDLEIAEIFMQ